MIAQTSSTIRMPHAEDRSNPLTYCDDGSERNPHNTGNQAATSIKYSPYRNPAINSTRKATLSGYFISLLSLLGRSLRSSPRVIRMQTASSAPDPQSRTGDPRRSQWRSFSSLLLGRNILYFLLGTVKCVRVRKLHIRRLVSLGR